ncbi:MAG: hypothetical protein ACRDND_21580 [Streptosporangiaceae bacterium]
MVAILVVARVACVTLRPDDRVAFFRGLGRAYWPVGGLALAVALAAGAVLALRHPRDGLLTATAVLRAVIAVLSLALIALGALLAT